MVGAGGASALSRKPAAVLPTMQSAEDAPLHAGVTITAPLRAGTRFDGSAADGAAVDHGDARTAGHPVHSLYGADREPTDTMLAEVDVMVFDMQDVGVRFYTYLSTLYYLMRFQRSHGDSAAGARPSQTRSTA